jgi:phosphate-selective porin OprO/OprP
MGPPATTGLPGSPAPADSGSRWDMSWQNGLFFRTTNGNFSFHAGGTVQYDAAWYSATPALELFPGGTGRFNDGTNLRRGRLFFEGTLYQAVDYKFELEFFNGIGFSPAGTQNAVVAGSVTNSPGPTDAWITVKDVPFFGNVRIGSQKEWFSLEHLNVYRYLEFMERSYLFDFAQPTAFNNGFTPGISTFRTWMNDRVFTAIGAYKNESDLLGFGLNDGNYAVTGRVATLPIWMPDDQIFWHVGGAMSHRDPVNGQVQIRLRDDIRNAPFPLLNLVANTGLINASSQNLFNLETAAVAGPLTIQAEYTANVINNASVGTGPNMGNLYFGAYYAEALLFLTGESRTWNVKNAFFNRVQPLRPLRLKPLDGDGIGLGAWEIAARYSYVDLSNKAIQAGRLDAGPELVLERQRQAPVQLRLYPARRHE